MKLFQLLLALFLSTSFALPLRAQDREISIKGTTEFKLKISGSKIALKNGPYDGSFLQSTNSEWRLLDKSSNTLAWGRLKDSKTIELGSTANQVQFLVNLSENGYTILTPESTFVSRVKIKEDKFNLYDKDAKRLLHGKLKDDGYGIKDEAGQQILKIKGTGSLKETSFFALPLDAKFQIILWALQTKQS